jgi:hypothetical protein
MFPIQAGNFTALLKLLFLKYEDSSDAKLTPSWGTMHLSQYTHTDFAFNIRN